MKKIFLLINMMLLFNVFSQESEIKNSSELLKKNILDAIKQKNVVWLEGLLNELEMQNQYISAGEMIPSLAKNIFNQTFAPVLASTVAITLARDLKLDFSEISLKGALKFLFIGASFKGIRFLFNRKNRQMIKLLIEHHACDKTENEMFILESLHYNCLPLFGFYPQAYVKNTLI